jgi:hypothetical protein
MIPLQVSVQGLASGGEFPEHWAALPLSVFQLLAALSSLHFAHKALLTTLSLPPLLTNDIGYTTYGF